MALKLALACSPGGHMLQMQQLEPLYGKYDRFFYTFRRKMSEELAKKERVIWVADSKRNPLLMLLNLFQALIAALRERPDVVIANGGGFVVPFCWWAWLLGARIVFIESFSRVDAPSVSGRLVHPIAGLFIVQWKGMTRFYPKAVYGGAIF